MERLVYFISLVIVFHIGVIDGFKVPHFRRDYKFLNSTNAYYKYHARCVTWEDAKKICESETATLYFPENELEYEEVKTLHRDQIWMWLGATRRGNGYDRTIDGRQTSDLYNKWATGEPNYVFGVEKCVTLMDNGELNDYHCNALLPFVCRTSLADVESGLKTIVEAEEIESTKESMLGHRNFYEFHKDKKTWQEANEICQNSASTLFYPEDQNEVVKVTELTNGSYWAAWIWLGASQTDYHSTQFITTDGILVNNSYHNWYPQEPLLKTSGPNCVTLSRDGNLKSDHCWEKLSFVCKSSVFVSAIKPERGLPGAEDIANSSASVVQVLNQSDAVNQLIRSLEHEPLPENCHQGADCKGTCGNIDGKSKSHVYFGNVVADEIQKFPVGKKLQAMREVMKVIRKQWTDVLDQCDQQ